MILKEIELFEGVDFEVMNEIAGICSEDSYSKDTVLFEKDEQAKCLYFLLVGFKVLQRLAGVISRRLSNAYGDLLSARSTDTTPSYG